MSVIAVFRPVATALVVAVTLACSPSEERAPMSSAAPPPSSSSPVPATAPPPPPPAPARRELASDPAQIADDLVADERALRDPASTPELLTAAAHRQQAAYRTIGRHPEWDPVVRPRIPAELLGFYDGNISARRHLTALSEGTEKDTVPAWRIVDPAPAGELLGYYREAEAATGVPWNFLAAVNFIETAFGRINGVSTAGAQGPMQFLPSTFAAYGDGGDINAPRDAILAAGRYLAANNFAGDPDHALYRYNNSNHYVRAVSDYAALMAADPAAFPAYHRWQVYYKTTMGDVLLPVGYYSETPIPVADYLATRPPR
ncbi:transglycosylase SLT domain-containing protein [Mycolicibacterium phlei]